MIQPAIQYSQKTMPEIHQYSIQQCHFFPWCCCVRLHCCRYVHKLCILQLDTKFCVSYFLHIGDIHIFGKKMACHMLTGAEFHELRSKNVVTVRN
jgi:hypothetical protein